VTKAKRDELCEKRRLAQEKEDELAAQSGRQPRPVAGTRRHFEEGDSSMSYPQGSRHHWDKGDEAGGEVIGDGDE
jgi:hypothetical protein